MGINQTEVTEIWVKTRPNRQKNGYQSYRAHRNIAINRTERTEIWVLNRQNRP